TAPEGSVTVPATLPRLVWAKAGIAKVAARSADPSTRPKRHAAYLYILYILVPGRQAAANPTEKLTHYLTRLGCVYVGSSRGKQTIGTEHMTHMAWITGFGIGAPMNLLPLRLCSRRVVEQHLAALVGQFKANFTGKQDAKGRLIPAITLPANIEFGDR